MSVMRGTRVAALLLLVTLVAGCSGAVPSGAPSAVTGAPSVTVDPVAGTAVVGQAVPITVHAVDTVGVSRIELHVADVVVASALSSGPAGQARLDATLTWTPLTAGVTALIVIAYRPDGTPSQPVAVAVAVAAAASGSAVPQPVATPVPTPGSAPTTEPPTATPATPSPTETPTPNPTQPPTPRPTLRPTPRPTPRPTQRPTARPTEAPTPTPTPTPLPDLAITVSYPGSAPVNTEITAGAYITNLGPGDAGAFGASWTYECANGGGSDSTMEDPLAAGQRHFLDIKFTSDTAGPCSVSVFADTGNDVTESNEDNNEFDFTVNVTN